MIWTLTDLLIIAAIGITAGLGVYGTVSFTCDFIDYMRAQGRKW